MLLYYNESIPDALITLFPEVPFDKSNFHVSHSMNERDRERWEGCEGVRGGERRGEERRGGT